MSGSKTFVIQLICSAFLLLFSFYIFSPIMIAVQKVTNVGFSLHDGMAEPESNLNSEQKRYSIR